MPDIQLLLGEKLGQPAKIQTEFYVNTNLDKLEMEVFSLPENSMQETNFLVAIQEYILQTLKLPYQVVAVCAGDMGFPDSRQIDIETWMPGQINIGNS